jgi:NitT/TauT family transport system permease protein
MKKTIKIGYLPITDHLVLGISSYFDKKRYASFSLETKQFHDWGTLKKSLEQNKLDGAFMLAPLAMQYSQEHNNIEVVLLGHREGSVFVVGNNSSIKSLKDLKNKTIAIPHKLSFHALLLRKLLEKEKLVYGRDVLIKEVSPPNMLNELADGTIDGYIVAEPFGSQAEEQHIGTILVLSKELEKHHMCCVLVLKRKIVDEGGESIQELVSSLVEAGNFMNAHPKKAAEIGSQFLHQSSPVLERVLSEKERRISAWDLCPIKDEFESLFDYMTEKKIMKKKPLPDDFIDTSFAEEGYKHAAIKRKKEKKKNAITKKIVLPSVVLFILLSIWYSFSHLGNLSSILLPSPVEVLHAIIEVFKEGILVEHISASLFRVSTGFIFASIIGIPAGLLIGTYLNLRSAFEPILQVLRPISPIAWIPLAILWFGIGNKPAIFIIFITSFFPILIATASAIKNIDPILVKSAINFGVTGKDLLKKVILPASTPYIFVGLRISLGFAWVIIVAAEMVGMRSGLGFMILDARNYLRTDIVIAGMVIIGLIGLGLDKLMGHFENRIKMKWSHKSSLGEK